MSERSLTEISSEQRWQVWLRQAKFDLAAAYLSFENEYYEWATYQAEQTVEKALKAVLIQGGGKAPKIHKLGILFGYCNQVNPAFRNTRFNFKHIESFTFISRYPFLLPDKERTPHELITEHDANQALMEASEVLLKITKLLKQEGVEYKNTALLTQEEFYTPQQVAVRLKHVRAQLVKLFDPENIILFGRFAREWGKPISGTMDILVIAKCDTIPFIERIYRAREATGGGFPIIEPLVYTPEEVQLLRQQDEAFLKSALEEGRTIYERPAASG